LLDDGLTLNVQNSSKFIPKPVLRYGAAQLFKRRSQTMTTKETISLMLDRVEAMAADKARLADKVALLRADRELISRWNEIKAETRKR
jgi:hypothetical protein